jgi:hypothetical protein
VVTIVIQVVTMPIHAITIPIYLVTMPIQVVTMPILVVTMRRSRWSRCADPGGHDGASRAKWWRRRELNQPNLGANSCVLRVSGDLRVRGARADVACLRWLAARCAALVT